MLRWQNHKGTNGVIAILESWLFLADGVVVVVGKGARVCVCVCGMCVFEKSPKVSMMLSFFT